MADYLRQYGEATTINFALWDYTTGKDLVTTAAHAAGDTTVMLDGAAPGNTSNGFVDKGTTYSLALTAAEMAAARIVVTCADQGTKAWMDMAWVIETFGHQSAQDPRGVVRRFTAAAATASTLTFDASASATNDAYINMIVRVVSNGTAAANEQMRYVESYNGTTKVATLNVDWTTTPTGTIVVEALYAPAGSAAAVDVVSIDGDTQAATDLATNIANLDATVSSRSSHDAEDVRIEVDANSTRFAAIGTKEDIADALLGRNIAGGSSTGRLVKEALYILRNKSSESAGTLTVYGTDDTTASWTATVTRDVALGAVSTFDP